MCPDVGMCTGVQCPQRPEGSLQPEFQAVVTRLTRVVETELRSSRRVASPRSSSQTYEFKERVEEEEKHSSLA